MSDLHVIIPAGGAGTRLWPVSRDALPKQFLPLVGERSTYQETLLRVADDKLFAPPIVITGADFRFFARRQAEDLGIEATVVIEPMRRDSGPAVAAAAALAKSRDPEAVVLALAADHVILDVEEFRATCNAGLKAAHDGRIVTFGITPNAPKTSYGYIRRGPSIGGTEVFAVEAFVEKPNAETASRYVAEGYLWNSGNFLFRADVLFGELQRFEPAMATAAEQAVAKAVTDLGFLRLDPEAFGSAPQKSIDYAVMEKTDRAAVVAGEKEALITERRHDLEHVAAHGAEAEVDILRAGLGQRAVAVAAQVRQDDVIVLRKLRRDLVPADVILRIAVQQQQRRAGAAVAQADGGAAGAHVEMLEARKQRRDVGTAPAHRIALVVVGRGLGHDGACGRLRIGRRDGRGGYGCTRGHARHHVAAVDGRFRFLAFCHCFLPAVKRRPNPTA